MITVLCRNCKTIHVQWDKLMEEKSFETLKNDFRFHETSAWKLGECLREISRHNHLFFTLSYTLSDIKVLLA